MRAIALAIILAGGGLEHVLLKVHGFEDEYKSANFFFVLVTFAAFIACIIGGW